MSKIIWLVVIAWVARTVWSAVKKAIDQAKAEIEADKARQQAGQQSPPPQRPTPKRPEERNAEWEAASSRAPQAVVVSAQEDPKDALLRMLAAAGVGPNASKVVEALAKSSPERAKKLMAMAAAQTATKQAYDSTDARRVDYDDDADEDHTDYDDDSDEDGTDYDDNAYENRTDYDDDARESSVDYDDTPPPPPKVWAPPAPPVVWAPPGAPVVYAMPDDRTSNAYNIAVRADIMSHRKPEALKRPAVHGLDATNIHSKVLVRDAVILDVLLTRYPNNPFFLRRR